MFKGFLKFYVSFETSFSRRKRFFRKPLQANEFNALQSCIFQGTNEGTSRFRNFHSTNKANIINRFSLVKEKTLKLSLLLNEAELKAFIKAS
jgi:hypothetical protein